MVGGASLYDSAQMDGGGGGGGAAIGRSQRRIIVESAAAGGAGAGAGVADTDGDSEESSEGAAHTSAVIFKERWEEKEARLRAAAVAAGKLSPDSKAGWRLFPIIVKANDDLRQEQFVSQLIRQFDRIFRDAELDVWLRPYEILALGPRAGVLEAIPDTVSLHALKRNWMAANGSAPGAGGARGTDSATAGGGAAAAAGRSGILPDFMRRHFGNRGLRHARECFVESCAAYSIVCYLLQIKDRHNGNILLDSEGHLIHIDWGFVLGQSPGRNFGFEKAPFKLTAEFVAVMGGPRSFAFQRFRNLCVRAFLEARRNREKIITLVEVAIEGTPSLPCFTSNPNACVDELRRRFQPGKSVREVIDFVNAMIDDSLDNWRTRWYDKWQRMMQGLL
ncbi:unnamed protein product [Phaeothamnion confervicola]